MRMRLRQIVMVAADLEPVEREIEQQLGVEMCHRDPGLSHFGLRNVLFPIGDKLLEVVSPVREGTTAGRLLDKRGGDGGYMLMLEVDEFGSLRERLDSLGVRVVLDVKAEGIVDLHLHPRDVGGAILAIDETETWGEWLWAGPEWRDHVRTDTVTDVVAIEIEAESPSAMAARWAEVLDRPVDGTVIALDEGEIRFVEAGARGEGVAGFVLRAADPGHAGTTTICGCRFELV
jgi:hypothetical protein